jgi:hypothetical protein
MLNRTPNIEPIQIWTQPKAPECYRRFVPFASDHVWIALVCPTVVRVFQHHLMLNGYRLGVNLVEQSLTDGFHLFYGKVTLGSEPELEKDA